MQKLLNPLFATCQCCASYLGMLTKKMVIALILGVFFFFSGIVFAQNETITVKLMKSNQVVERGEFLYLKVSAPIREPSFPLEKILTLRGEKLLGQWLCSYVQSPERRLETVLHGMQIIQSEEDGEHRHILLKIKRQMPDCKIISIGKNSPAIKNNILNSKTENSISISKENSSQAEIDIENNNIKIKNYKLEY
jgi:hypothetical protein